MAEKRIVLVTGVSGEWGGRVAANLMNQPDVHVIGLDDKPPKEEIKGLDLIQADFRNPVIVELLREEVVDTVYHLAFTESERPNENAFDLNVIGTMKFLGMCAEGGVRKVILKSSTMVYGAQPTNSMFLREDHALNGNKNYGYIRDLIEMEAFCNGFRGQVPDMIITTLRFAHIVGPHVDTPMARFLREEEAFVLLGFDPLMQVIHVDDVVRALVHLMNCDAPGAFNIAAEGAMPLWKLMGLAGKLAAPVFHPLAYTSVSLLGPRYAPIDLDYLRYVCIGDTDKMRTMLQFVPQYTAVEALREFASQQRLRQYLPESVMRASEEERLRDTVERRRRAREQAAAEASHVAPSRAVAVRPTRRRSVKRAVKRATE
ncbi:MAG: NAD-dependent epimerase/dehydratase family protein [Anaerolineae bacterium]